MNDSTRTERSAGAVQVVLGAGLTGLMIADLLRQHGPVEVIESSSRIGGLLGSFDFGEHGCFDHGAHILAETGDRDLDAYLADLLEPDQWVWLTGHRRNFAGLVYNGRIQTHTAYPDITTLPHDQYRRCMADLPSIDRQSDDARSAGDYLRRRYGDEITRVVGAPIIEGFARASIDELHPMVTRLCPFDRLAMFDESETHRRAGDPSLGRRLAFVDQRDLPQSEQSTLASFYPRQRGIGRVVDALAARLSRAGVLIHTDARVRAMTSTSRGLELVMADGSQIQASHVYCTAHPLSVAASAGVSVDLDCMDPPRTSVLCHLVLDEAPGLGDVHYLQVADPDRVTYRYTNYDAFCPEGHPTGVPVTVEMLVDGAPKYDEVRLIEVAIDEIAAVGVTNGPPRVQFQALKVLPYGFPRPTLANIAAVADVRTRIGDRFGDALTFLGVGSRDGLFFMTDVLRAAYDHHRTHVPHD